MPMPFGDIAGICWDTWGLSGDTPYHPKGRLFEPKDHPLGSDYKPSKSTTQIIQIDYLRADYPIYN